MRQSRRGTIYIMVLGVSALVLTIGVGAAYASRENLERRKNSENLLAADAAACSALELAFAFLNRYPSARASMSDEQFLLPTEYGDFAIDFAVLEPDGKDRGDSLNRIKIIALAQGDGVKQYRSMIIEPTFSPRSGEAAFRVIPGTHRIEIEKP